MSGDEVGQSVGLDTDAVEASGSNSEPVAARWSLRPTRPGSGVVAAPSGPSRCRHPGRWELITGVPPPGPRVLLV